MGMLAVLTAALSVAYAGEKDSLIRQYSDEHLVFHTEVQYSFVDSSSSTSSVTIKKSTLWAVQDSSGRVLPTTEFAPKVGDQDRLDKLTETAAMKKSRGTKKIIIGAPVLVAGLAVQGLNLRNPDNTSLVMAYAGAGLMVGGLGVGYWGYNDIVSGKAPLTNVTLAYSPAEARQRVAEYNQTVRDRLGLSTDDTQHVDAMDEAGNTSSNAVYTEPTVAMTTHAPRLQVQPVVSLGYVGAMGRF